MGAALFWIAVGLWSATALARWHAVQNRHIWGFHDTVVVVLAVISGPISAIHVVCFYPDIRAYLWKRVERRISR